MQALGRRFALAFNRRHTRSGSLWDGRYRAAVVESGALLLEAMVFVDQSASVHEAASAGPRPSWSSARQHVGHESPAPLVDPPEYWALGNTPFDRASAYRVLVEEPLRAEQVQRLISAANRGLAVGSEDFLSALQTLAVRPVGTRPRGRPRKRVVTLA
jgi:putative transposase